MIWHTEDEVDGGGETMMVGVRATVGVGLAEEIGGFGFNCP